MKNYHKEWIKNRVEAFKSIGYMFGESTEDIAKRYGFALQEIAKLDSNENLFIPKNELIKMIQEALLDDFDPRLYPREEARRLINKISNYVKLPTEYIIIGNGSDEIMERVARFALEKGDRALSIAPTFSMYRHAVELQRAKYIEVPLKDDFSLNVKGILSKATPKTKILFICSPNNPTANRFETDDLVYLIDKFPGIVVVDEAYVEFSGGSLAPLVKEFDNLIVLRTFSKAFGLASFRLGYCLASPEISKTLSASIGLPYPVNTLALKVGVKILENVKIMQEAVEKLKIERSRLIEDLRRVNGVYAFDSETNFILIYTQKSAEDVYQGLLSRGIIVKNLGRILKFRNCFRVTVGLPEMNTKLIESLKEILGE
ncbi:MAG: histidinol-phosphate transaminase [Candidatus Bathyarchaeia archaeon]